MLSATKACSPFTRPEGALRVFIIIFSRHRWLCFITGSCSNLLKRLLIIKRNKLLKRIRLNQIFIAAHQPWSACTIRAPFPACTTSWPRRGTGTGGGGGGGGAPLSYFVFDFYFSIKKDKREEGLNKVNIRFICFRSAYASKGCVDSSCACRHPPGRMPACSAYL
uniref:Uncharacterized protein n=1 Tax=Morchella brunnea TaxID=1174671 RepID=A0A8K1I842_9PEZI|nr:hypothetical protein LK370_mgp012 [Morchella brunnea]UBU98467.1 hypothetical protein [Morchella brunnea]